MKSICVEYDEFEYQKLWESFMAFFRCVKGHDDWTDEEIAIGINNDDLKEYCEWVRKTLGDE